MNSAPNSVPILQQRLVTLRMLRRYAALLAVVSVSGPLADVLEASPWGRSTIVVMGALASPACNPRCVVLARRHTGITRSASGAPQASMLLQMRRSRDAQLSRIGSSNGH